jgi:hypothetical protein
VVVVIVVVAVRGGHRPTGDTRTAVTL